VTITEEKEGAFTLDSRHILDLGEAIRQHAITNRPMKPLCRPDCRGLCPTCGANRNQQPCECKEASADPRWSALRQLHPPLNR
jgi:uncharacterized protein